MNINKKIVAIALSTVMAAGSLAQVGPCFAAEELNRTQQIGQNQTTQFQIPESKGKWDKTKEFAAKGWDKTKDLTAKGWVETKDLTAKGWVETKEVAAKGWDRTKKAAANTRDEAKKLAKEHSTVAGVVAGAAVAAGAYAVNQVVCKNVVARRDTKTKPFGAVTKVLCTKA